MPPLPLPPVFRDCSRAVCDGELIRSLTDGPFKPGIMSYVSFLGQVRSLTYDAISR